MPIVRGGKHWRCKAYSTFSNLTTSGIGSSVNVWKEGTLLNVQVKMFTSKLSRQDGGRRFNLFVNEYTCLYFTYALKGVTFTVPLTNKGWF